MKDDKPLYSITKDISGGMNNRVEGSNIAENQITVAYNADLATPGQSRKRPGLTLIQDLNDL